MTAGHGSRPGQTYNDGPYEMVKTARMKIREGQDWIKIAISGGVATDGDGGITESLMTPEEMSAVIDASHRFGVKVAAHSGSTAATNAAVDAGMVSLRLDGARKVVLGMTTPEEVMLMTAESTD